MTTRPLALLVPLTLCAALLVGCGGDGDDPEAAPSATTSETSTDATTEPTDDPSEDPSEDTSEPVEPVDPDDDPGDPFGDDDTDEPAAPVPAEAAELCAAFETAFDAFLAAGDDYPSGDSDPVPADLLDAFRQWGRDLADADLPSSFSDAQREGVDVMSRLLLAIPDRATGRDLQALDSALSDSEDEQVEAVTDYVDDTCGLDL